VTPGKEGTMDWALERLRELRTEYAGAESQLVQLDRQRMQLHEAMLRVAGAIQVLEELVSASGVFDSAPLETA
jgi:prefoldin subunit 5